MSEPLAAAVAPAPLPITEDDETLRRLLADAHLPSLLPALAQITGDLSLLRDELLPDTAFTAGEQGGYTAEQQELARELALEALIRFRDAGSRPAAFPDEESLRRMMRFLMAAEPDEAYLPLLLEELAPEGVDRRAPAWQKDEIAADRDFRVAIIGAGMSGLLAGIRLRQAGVDFVILEKNSDVGGTWLENVYPGCRVDVSNHLYSYSFAQRDDWPHFFSTQEVLLDYFRECARRHGIVEQIRFDTEVVQAEWSDEEAQWRLSVRGADDRVETLAADAVISAVGQLNRPKLPEIEGRERFAGPAFHSARWQSDVELEGRRVGVIGTGASAAQLVPIVAEQAAELVVFQRTPPWLSPTLDYHDEVPEGLRWLFRHVPHYAQWYRFWLFWTTAEGLLPFAEVDPGWQGGEHAVSALNEELGAAMTEYLRQMLADRPDLLERVVPRYPPASKRILRDNGAWPLALRRDNVELVTEPIREITERGVVAADGRERELDVLVYATGFQASRFLMPMTVRGRGGADLHERWGGDARAYLGITLPDFPNLFVLYGPNTNIVVNGSIIYFSECEVHYVLQCIRQLLATGKRALDCRRDVHDRYNERIDAGNLGMAWGVSKVNSWYKNETGRVAQNWPFSLLEYWQQTREVEPSDYEWL